MAAYQVVTNESWFSRIGNSIKGVLFGLVLFVAAFPLLWWNEGRAVNRAKVLAAGKSSVVRVAADKVDPANAGKLVYLTGQATTTDTLTDPLFAVSVTAIRLDRTAEMYQWKEHAQTKTEKSLGGSEQTVTTYTYKAEWSDQFTDSSSFQDPQYRGKNPPGMPVESKRWVAQDVTLGAFDLSPELVAGMTWTTAYAPKSKPEASADAPASRAAAGGAVVSSFTTPAAMTLRDGVFYSGDPSAPKVGDVRVTFATVQPQAVSVVATQVGNTFEDSMMAGQPLEQIVVQGTQSPDQIFAKKEAENAMLTWLLRLGGLLAMTIGLYLMTSPLVVVADVVPLIGSLIGAGASLFAFLTALGLSLVTVSLAWVAYRPIIGIPLLIVGVASLAGLVAMRRRRPVAAA